MANTRPRYRTITREQIRQALDAWKMGQSRFAMLTGIDPSKIEKIMDGRVDERSGRPFLLPYGTTVLMAYMDKFGRELAYEVLKEYLVPEDESMPVE